ncbi:MAG: exodeoxyribonuclease VII small subunit [Lachnospiraceae bacterium]|nr:exodeoxyribonuclease VII small subunit [Lachnospiraceae bacterium]
MKKEEKGQDIVQQQAEEEQFTDLSLEETFEQIEEVIALLETEEITLEQSFQEYNRGMKLLQHCNEAIDRVEKKVLQINEDGGLDEF